MPDSPDATGAAVGAPGWQEEDWLPLSGLQHVVFCERQFALIHVERQWAENSLTAEGRVLHEQVDRHSSESRRDVRIARAASLRCVRLGLVGRADVVEFHRDDCGAQLAGQPGRWRPFPVEYKRGRPKSGRADEVQLCAQAVCLEEMLGVEVPRGALFYGAVRRRLDVSFDPGLRRGLETAAARAHELFALRLTPMAQRQPKCRACSLVETCRPGCDRPVARYIESRVRYLLEEGIAEQ